ncbi:MAG: hypothetical protein RL208_805 [Pseudomonadota bacterium]|jgi:drug/metabolite transporter (DMT)-like permease
MVKLAFLTIILCWSSSWLIVGFNAQFPVQTEFSVFYRKIIACAISFFVAIMLKERLVLTKKELLFSISVGFFAIFVQYMFTYRVSTMLISGFISCIGATSLLTSEIISSMVHKHRISIKKILIGLIGIAGVALLMHKSFQNSQSIEGDKQMLTGIILATLLSISNVISSIIINKYPEIYNKIPKMTFMATTYLFSCILFLAIGLFKTNGVWVPIPRDIGYISSLIYLSVFASFFAFWAFYYLSNKIGPTKTSYYTIINPVIAMILSSIFEPFDWDLISIIGIFIITSSAYIGLKQKDKPHDKSQHKKHHFFSKSFKDKTSFLYPKKYRKRT